MDPATGAAFNAGEGERPPSPTHSTHSTAPLTDNAQPQPESGSPQASTASEELVTNNVGEVRPENPQEIEVSVTQADPEPQQAPDLEGPPRPGSGRSPPAPRWELPGQQPADIHSLELEQEKKWTEWRSNKISFRRLACQFVLTFGLIVTITALLQVSQANSGFADLGDPPGFLAANPDLNQAIWLQGLQYTSFPAFLMGVYKSMWDYIISALAARQPFVELNRDFGAATAKTLLLDYNAHSTWVSIWTARRNGHYFLLACMVSSLWLTLVVPFTAFLFTPKIVIWEYPAAVLFMTEFNVTRGIGTSEGLAMRTPLDSAAATLLLGAPPLPGTNGTLAFPSMMLRSASLSDGEPGGQIPVSTNSTAYMAQPGCRVLQEGTEYQYTLASLAPGQVSALLWGSDRGCWLSNSLNFRVQSGANPTPMSITAFVTQNCGEDAGWSRVVILAGRYSGDGASQHDLSNFTAVSCKSSYWTVPGVLAVALSTASPPSPPALGEFAADWSAAAEQPSLDPHIVFGVPLMLPTCFSNDDVDTTQPGNEFARHVLDLARSHSPDQPLAQDALLRGTESLFRTTYAVYAATKLFQPLDQPRVEMATATMSKSRLVVVPPMAYLIIATLLVVLGLNVGVFFYAQASSILTEEPVGILGMAGLVHRSDHLKNAIDDLLGEQGYSFDGRLGAAALASSEFMSMIWKYEYTDETMTSKKGKVVRGMGTSRPP